VFQDDTTHPWYAGIIVDVVFKDPAAADKDKEAASVTIHKCGNIENSLDPKSPHFRWYVNTEETNPQRRNMFLSTKTSRKPDRGFKAQLTTEDAASLADWGKIDSFFTSTSCIKHNVLVALSKNPNVPWTLPK